MGPTRRLVLEACRLAGQLAGGLAGCLARKFVRLPAGWWLAGWLVGRGWLAQKVKGPKGGAVGPSRRLALRD